MSESSPHPAWRPGEALWMLAESQRGCHTLGLRRRRGADQRSPVACDRRLVAHGARSVDRQEL